MEVLNIDKKGKIATIIAFLVVISIIGSFAFAAPKLCNNGKDDDNDGLIDYPSDLGCSARNDNSEISASLVCDNGIDETNDADSLKDFRLSGGDPGCTSATDTSEIGQCEDSLDNDGDSFIDYLYLDSKCTSYGDDDESPRDFCNDNDGGINVNTAGNVTGEDESVSFSFSDTCIDATYLTEYYCGWYSQDYMPLSTNTTCAVNGTTMCSSGRCV